MLRFCVPWKSILILIPEIGICEGHTFVKPILHYAFSLRFGNVCEHKCEKNARKT